MASIVFRNSSRRLLRAYFSKLGWQANVIWRIAFFNQLQVYPSWLWRSDLYRASLGVSIRVRHENFYRVLCKRPCEPRGVVLYERGRHVPTRGSMAEATSSLSS